MCHASDPFDTRETTLLEVYDRLKLRRENPEQEQVNSQKHEQENH